MIGRLKIGRSKVQSRGAEPRAEARGSAVPPTTYPRQGQLDGGPPPG